MIGPVGLPVQKFLNPLPDAFLLSPEIPGKLHIEHQIHMLSALDLAMDLRGTEIEQIRMPIDGAYESMPVAGMATQQIDWLVNREALHTFLLDSFVVVEDE